MAFAHLLWRDGALLLQSDKMPFSGKSDEEKNEATISGAIEYKHGEPEIFQSLISGLCEVDMSKRLGCNGGLHDLQAHPYFVGYNWEALEYGKVDAPIKPNVNDINAPSAKDIAAFVPPKDVTWEAADQAKFADFGYGRPLYCPLCRVSCACPPHRISLGDTWQVHGR